MISSVITKGNEPKIYFYIYFIIIITFSFFLYAFLKIMEWLDSQTPVSFFALLCPCCGCQSVSVLSCIQPLLPAVVET